jgi:hypothetical protein
VWSDFCQSPRFITGPERGATARGHLVGLVAVIVRTGPLHVPVAVGPQLAEPEVAVGANVRAVAEWQGGVAA